MLKDFFSNRLFIGALAFFVLCVGGSRLYSWHVQRTTESDMARHARFLQERENQNETRPAETVDVSTETPGFVDTPEENTDTPMSDENEREALENETETLDILDAFVPDELVSAEEAPAEDVPVSPYGFGPYPEVPEAFIQKVGAPPWLVDAPFELPEDTKKGVEIIARVLIGLWKQGDESIINGIRDSGTGRVYPLYENTIYIRHLSASKESPAKRLSVFSDPSVMITEEERQRLQEGGEAPAGIRVLDFDTAGVDPSQFLNIR